MVFWLVRVGCEGWMKGWGRLVDVVLGDTVAECVCLFVCWFARSGLVWLSAWSIFAVGMVCEV